MFLNTISIYIYLGWIAALEIDKLNAHWLETHKPVGSQCHRVATRNFLAYNL